MNEAGPAEIDGGPVAFQPSRYRKGVWVASVQGQPLKALPRALGAAGDVPQDQIHSPGAWIHRLRRDVEGQRSPVGGGEQANRLA